MSTHTLRLGGTDAPRRPVADDEGHDRGGAAAARRASTSSISARASRTFRRRRTSTAAAHAAIDANFTKYTANMGIADLREAVAARYRADYGVQLRGRRGHHHGRRQAGAVSTPRWRCSDPGDEVITHAPGWPTLAEQIKLADATPVIVRTHAEDGFALKADAILAAVTPRTRGIIINSPGNPTGALMSRGRGAQARDRGGAARALDRHRSLLREAHLRRRAAQPAEDLRRRDARPARAVRIGVEGLRDDRLALRLDGRARRPVVQACQRAAEPLDVERQLDHAEGGGRGADRTAGLRRRRCCASIRRAATRCSAGWPRSRACGARRRRARSTCFPTSRTSCRPTACARRSTSPTGCLTEEHVVTTAGEAFDAPGFLRLSYATSLDRLREGVTRLIRFATSGDGSVSTADVWHCDRRPGGLWQTAR